MIPEIIKIKNTELNSFMNNICIDTKELYDYMGLFFMNYDRWIEKNILQNEFAILGEDYEFQGNTIMVTIDFAKMLGMMSRSKKGDEIRRYFIDVEKKYIETLKEKLLANHTPTLIAEYGSYGGLKNQREGYLPPIRCYGGGYIHIHMSPTEAEKWKQINRCNKECIQDLKRIIIKQNKMLHIKDEAFVEEEIILPFDDIAFLEYLLSDNYPGVKESREKH